MTTHQLSQQDFYDRPETRLRLALSDLDRAARALHSAQTFINDHGGMDISVVMLYEARVNVSHVRKELAAKLRETEVSTT